MKRICLVPQLSGVGGMVSFRHRLASGLAARGLEVTHDLAGPALTAVLVIGGTRQLVGLLRLRRRGVRIVQRLDGMNWLHRRRRTGLRHFLRAEWGNWLLATIRSRLADHIVYQSEFSKCWWERARGPTPAGDEVIYNGVDLQAYTTQGSQDRPPGTARLLLVEGSLMGGYELGLETAIGLAEGLAERLRGKPAWDASRPVELMIAGRVAAEVRQRWDGRASSSGPIRWAGLVPREQIPALDRSAHLLYSSDLNAACPNSVIEALACGLPVLSFDTGALPELVPPGAGRVVPYGGDPWRLDPPDIGALIDGAQEILAGGEAFRLAARAQAEEAFDLDRMVSRYLQALDVTSQAGQ